MTRPANKIFKIFLYLSIYIIALLIAHVETRLFKWWADNWYLLVAFLVAVALNCIYE